jgi:hypothetical protein
VHILFKLNNVFRKQHIKLQTWITEKRSSAVNSAISGSGY